ncbi:MAG: DUF1800 family protein [Robiginitomaculum sp.]
MTHVLELIFTRPKTLTLSLCSAALLSLSACGGGGSSGGATIAPPPTGTTISKAFKTEQSTQQFLTRASFGPTQSGIDSLMGTEVSTWLVAEFNKPTAPILPTLITEKAALPEDERIALRRITDLYLDNAIAGDDQLRQRMTLALSEIVVVSSGGFNSFPLGMAYYVDTLSENAFGNYEDLLKDISYSPAMGLWLTYIQNEKGDADTGRVPDENYAREILQLFSIGLIELNMDGTPKLDSAGNEVETFDNDDITGLAKVFTGMSVDNGRFYNVYRDRENWYQPMVFYPEHHSELEKTFLGTTIPANTSGPESFDLALKQIFDHPNLAPFVSKQLIQRFVTSNPSPAYIGRVASAFEIGRYVLPNGNRVGTGRRGDLRATIAAVLTDAQALQDPASKPADFGKVREPLIRVINWARAFNETTPDTANEYYLSDRNTALRQTAFRAPSVFNFFRPGYIAAGMATGDAGLVAPELQIVNESSAIEYVNFINRFIYDTSPTYDDDDEAGVNADYTAQLAIADNAQALMDNLDLLLTGNELNSEAKTKMVALLETMAVNTGTDTEDDDRLSRVHVAISMVMTSPGYLVQR